MKGQWVSCRLGRRGITVVGFLAVLAYVGAAALGLGPQLRWHWIRTPWVPAGVAITAMLIVGPALFVAASRRERRIARIALARLAERERALADAQRLAQVGSVTWDLRTGSVVWSDEIYRILGLGEGDHEPNLATWRERVHPDDRDEFESTFAAAHRTRSTYHAIFRIVRPDGRVRTLECRGHVEFDDQGGEPGRLLGTVQDITATAFAEERFRSLFQAAPYAADRDGPQGLDRAWPTPLPRICSARTAAACPGAEWTR